MVHQCPFCGQPCDCDCEDTTFAECEHECDPEYEEDDA